MNDQFTCTTRHWPSIKPVCVTRGRCLQLVDFKPTSCEPGSLLVLRPDQAHNLGHDEDWDGWIVLFRSEFLLAESAPARDLKLAVDLEAKRLLVHTDVPIALIAEKLGFEEATNFSKFFKRETGCTPAQFRRQVTENFPPKPRA